MTWRGIFGPVMTGEREVKALGGRFVVRQDHAAGRAGARAPGPARRRGLAHDLHRRERLSRLSAGPAHDGWGARMTQSVTALRMIARLGARRLGAAGARQSVLRVFAGGLLLACCGIGFAGAADGPSAWIKRFTDADNAINQGRGYAFTHNNDTGTLAWGEAYLLEGYMDLYLATGDLQWATKVANRADALIKKLDIARGVSDFRGRLMHGWGATSYGLAGKRITWIVHSGMLYTQLLRFAGLAASDRKLATFRILAKDIIARAEEAEKEFASRWHTDGLGRGTYYFEKDEPVEHGSGLPLPLNMSLAFGRTLIRLHTLTGKPRYRERTAALARYLKSHLHLAANGGYEWKYWPAWKANEAMEDLSHGAIVIDFVILAVKANIEFTKQDALAMVRALTNSYDGNDFSVRVNGHEDGKMPADFGTASGRWLDLAEFDCDAYRPVADYFSRQAWKSPRNHERVMVAFAKLAKYEGKCGT